MENNFGWGSLVRKINLEFFKINGYVRYFSRLVFGIILFWNTLDVLFFFDCNLILIERNIGKKIKIKDNRFRRYNDYKKY